MKEINIIGPSVKHKDEVRSLFSLTVRNNFREEGILESMAELAEKEIESLCKNFELGLASDNSSEFYLVAEYNNRIVGIIAYGKPSELISKNLENRLVNVPEIKSVYILPVFQKQGIGSQLFEAILEELQNINVLSFYLDSGYKKAKQYWQKKLGNPVCVLPDYWGKGVDHLIWHTTIKDLKDNNQNHK